MGCRVDGHWKKRRRVDGAQQEKRTSTRAGFGFMAQLWGHDKSLAGDHLSLPAPESQSTHSRGKQPRLQCSGLVAMCRKPQRDERTVSQRYALLSFPSHTSLTYNLLAHIPLFLYPFLNTTSKSRPFEYLRLTSLGVIGALVKNEPSSTTALPSGTPGNQGNTNSSPTITFLLTTEIIPLCLRIMETGSELSKTVAIFIVQKILLDDTGLGYICATYERFYAVGTVLSNMVVGLVEVQTVRLLKHVVRCFLR